MLIKRLLTLLTFCLLITSPTPLLAASLADTTGPSLTITPTTTGPGTTIHVSVSGITASFQQNVTLCLGVLGPGNNVQENKSPAFREEIGMIAIDATGSGQADVAVPKNLVAGSYQLIIGGCARQQGLAPLSSIASTTLTVSTDGSPSGTGTPNPTGAPAATGTPSPAGSTKPGIIQPTKLPTTGGWPADTLFALCVLGTITLGIGYLTKRRSGT